MKIDVIINCYNYDKYVSNAIDSVLAQTYPVNKLVIIDDGSSDNSALIIDRYSKLENIKIVKKSNGGQLSCFNAGFEEASGDVVAFLDADDLFCPNYLKIVADLYSKNKTIGCSYAGYRKIDEFGDLISDPVYSDTPDERVLRAFYLHSFYGAPTSGIAFRRTALEFILPYKSLFWRVCADDVLVMGASYLRIKALDINDVCFLYRQHSSNNWLNKKSNKIDQLIKRDNHNIIANQLASNLFVQSGFVLRESIVRELISSVHEKNYKYKDFRRIIKRGNLNFKDRLILSFYNILSRPLASSLLNDLLLRFLNSRALK